MQFKRFSPTDFVIALEENALSPELGLAGIVKTSENKDMMLFSMFLKDVWIEIPLTLIKEIEHIDNLYQSQVSYPIVRLIFREPNSNNVVEKSLFSILVSIIQNLKNLKPEKGCNCNESANLENERAPADACDTWWFSCITTGLPTLCRLYERNC